MKSNVIKILELLNSYKIGGKNGEEPLVIPADELIQDIDYFVIRNILARLHLNKCIKVTGWAYRSEEIAGGVDPNNAKDRRNRSFRIKLLKGFEDCRQKLIDIDQNSDDQLCLWITYSNKREVLLNDVIILAKTNFNSTNDLVFRYLYDNPNKSITKNELEGEATKKRITKRLHDIVKDLGFKKELFKIFFDVSKTDIMFRNPITKQDLADLENPKFRIKI